jgi:hypothetical protein
MAEHPARTPAQRVVTGRYALTSRLGRRGERTVWRAQDTVLRRDVAVEEIQLPSGEQDAAWASLLRQARAAARRPLAGTITVFDAVRDGDEVFVVTELAPARTLAEVVESDGPLAPDKAAAIGLDLLTVLVRLERARIVHEGVTPTNVLLVDGRAKLSGLGLGEPSDFGAVLCALAATLHFAVTGRLQRSPTPPPGLAAALAELRGEHPAQGPSLPRLREELAALAGPVAAKAVAPHHVGAVSSAGLGPPEPPPEPLPTVTSRTAVVAPVAPRMPARAWPRALRPVPVALLAVGLAVTVVIALLVLPVPPSDQAPGSAPPGPVVSRPASRPPRPTPGAWRAYGHPAAGFTIRVPADWSQEQRPRRLLFRAPNRGVAVALSWTDGPFDPLAELRDRAFQYRATPGYRELVLAEVSFRGRPAAEWAFQSTGPDGRLHGRALALNGPRHGYVLSIEAPESAWPTARPVLEQISQGLMVG